MSKCVRDVIRDADNVAFAAIVEAAKGSCKSIDKVVSEADVPRYKKFALKEYADKNKDLLLAMDTHTEMKPIVATDDLAPTSTENGKVENNIKNDADLVSADQDEEPEKHPSRGVQQVDESMTDDQKAKREEIVLSMKKDAKALQDRYGDRWESVMYAIATKRAIGDDGDHNK